MSARKKKEMRQGYRQAGAIYWTTEMEQIILKIRRERNALRFLSAGLILYVIGWSMHLRGIF